MMIMMIINIHRLELLEGNQKKKKNIMISHTCTCALFVA